MPVATAAPAIMPAAAAARGQPRPPDAEQQQRAERARGEREGPADEHARCRPRAWRARAGAGATMPDAAAIRNRARRRAALARPDVVRDRAGDRDQQAGRGRHERGERARGDDRGEDVARQARPRRGGHAQHDGVGVAGDVELGRERAAEQAVDGGEQVEGAEQAEHAHGGPARGRAVRVGVEADEDVRQAHRARGTSPAAASRSAAASRGRTRATGRDHSSPVCASMPVGDRDRGVRRQAQLARRARCASRRCPGTSASAARSSSTTMPSGPVRGSSFPNSAALRRAARRGGSAAGSPGSAIANTLTQYWNACT